MGDEQNIVENQKLKAFDLLKKKKKKKKVTDSTTRNIYKDLS